MSGDVNVWTTDDLTDQAARTSLNFNAFAAVIYEYQLLYFVSKVNGTVVPAHAINAC
jgi:hypothetical protein